MGQDRINNFVILYSESDVARKVDLKKLVDVYSLKKERGKITLK